MPIYEFVCKKCSYQFEKLVFSSDTFPLTCPRCEKTDVEKLMSAASIRAQGIPTGSGGFKPPACSPRSGG